MKYRIFGRGMIYSLGFCLSLYAIMSEAQQSKALQLKLGQQIYQARCAVCHGDSGRATGPLAYKSKPSATDFSSCAFRERLAAYPGVIVASIILMPNGNLIPNTLKRNGVYLPDKQWTADELRTVNTYIKLLMEQAPDLCKK
ncbi:MAG TPA: cytochrome c [Coxiellaceae bacterium]|nr:cytochrome c [Coxiellaceae bacterium]